MFSLEKGAYDKPPFLVGRTGYYECRNVWRKTEHKRGILPYNYGGMKKKNTQAFTLVEVMMVIGIILGVMAWKSNSIIPSMIVHFINNGIALIFANSKPAQYQWYLYKNHVSIPIIIAAIIAVFYGMKLFYKFCDSSFEEENFDTIQQDTDN